MAKGDNQFCSKSSWGTRHILVSLCFVMGVLLYSLRFNISIGIVAMVKDNRTHNNNGKIIGSDSTSLPLTNTNGDEEADNDNNIMCPATFFRESESSKQNLSYSQIDNETTTAQAVFEAPTFDWDERDQGIILGCFFWGYVITQLPGGLLAQKYGGKWIISLGILITGLLSIALPHAAVYGGKEYVIAIRVLQGLGEGFIIPAVINILSKWIPPEERACCFTLSLAGLPFGTATTMLVSGHLIAAYGWPSVFYLPGALSIIFFIIWTWKVHASPECHPNISEMELKYIQESLRNSNRSGKLENQSNSSNSVAEEENVSFWDVPWKEIFFSLPAWSVLMAQFCNSWSHNILKSEGPKYLHSALNFDIHQNGYVASSPFFLQLAFSLLTGRVSDFLVERKVISMLFARRFCNTIGQWGLAVGFVGIVLSGCNRLPAVICYIFSGMIGGAMNSGAYVNVIDISPKYSGVIEGVINCAANFAGFGAPYLAGLILYNEPSITGWSYVFLAPVALNVIGNAVFLFGSSVKIQSWNELPDKNKNRTGQV